MAIHVEQGSGMADANVAGFQLVLGTFAEPQEPQEVSDGGALFASALGDLLMAQAVVRGQAVKGGRDFDRVEIFALNVFNQREFQEPVAIHSADEGGNFGKPGQAGRAPATFAGDNAVAIFAVAVNHDRLQDAVGTDGLGEFLDLVVSNTSRGCSSPG